EPGPVCGGIPRVGDLPCDVAGVCEDVLLRLELELPHEVGPLDDEDGLTFVDLLLPPVHAGNRGPSKGRAGIYLTFDLDAGANPNHRVSCRLAEHRVGRGPREHRDAHDHVGEDVDALVDGDQFGLVCDDVVLQLLQVGVALFASGLAFTLLAHLLGHALGLAPLTLGFALGLLDLPQLTHPRVLRRNLRRDSEEVSKAHHSTAAHSASGPSLNSDAWANSITATLSRGTSKHTRPESVPPGARSPDSSASFSVYSQELNEAPLGLRACQCQGCRVCTRSL